MDSNSRTSVLTSVHLSLQRLLPRERQQLLRERGAMVDRSPHAIDYLPIEVSARLHGKDKEPVRKHREQVVEVVRNAARHASDRLHLLRLGQRRVGLSQRGGRFRALSNVAHDLGEADQSRPSRMASTRASAEKRLPSMRPPPLVFDVAQSCCR
jgi:hypothetical protein